MKECRSSLRINEDALAKQILNPGGLPPCPLHARMRMTERIIKMLLLAGMRIAMPRRKVKEFCEKINVVVNSQVLMRSNTTKQGQWNVPLDKNDCNKLGDVKLSG